MVNGNNREKTQKAQQRIFSDKALLYDLGMTNKKKVESYEWRIYLFNAALEIRIPGGLSFFLASFQKKIW